MVKWIKMSKTDVTRRTVLRDVQEMKKKVF